jgi:hypothetical protein
MPSPEQRNPEPEAVTPESSEPSTADTPTSPPSTTEPEPAAVERDTAEHHIAELVKEKASELTTEGLSERFDSPPGRDLDHEPTHPEEIGYEGQR